MYQMTFAIITPALIIGAYVERIKFSAVLLFSGLWLIVVYAPVAHWVWGGGWLAAMGVKDYAGGIVVHTTAGVSALIVAVALGKREGFPHHALPPHAPWIVMVGAAMLWVGWFGFNAGRALTAGADAGMAMLVTHIGRGRRVAHLDVHRVAALRQAEPGRHGDRHDRGPRDDHAGIGLRRPAGRDRHRHRQRIALLRRRADREAALGGR